MAARAAPGSPVLPCPPGGCGQGGGMAFPAAGGVAPSPGDSGVLVSFNDATGEGIMTDENTGNTYQFDFEPIS